MTEPPRITKRELAKVGLRIGDEHAAEWMHRGWCELSLYLWSHEQVRKVEERVFEEDGA